MVTHGLFRVAALAESGARGHCFRTRGDIKMPEQPPFPGGPGLSDPVRP